MGWLAEGGVGSGVAGETGVAAAAGDGAVLGMLTIQPEGRRAMSAREFLSGRKLAAGALLGQA